jgi:hypothetical protein
LINLLGTLSIKVRQVCCQSLICANLMHRDKKIGAPPAVATLWRITGRFFHYGCKDT